MSNDHPVRPHGSALKKKNAFTCTHWKVDTFDVTQSGHLNRLRAERGCNEAVAGTDSPTPHRGTEQWQTVYSFAVLSPPSQTHFLEPRVTYLLSFLRGKLTPTLACHLASSLHRYTFHQEAGRLRCNLGVSSEAIRRSGPCSTRTLSPHAKS